jgi:hypothetical protein
MMRRAIATSFVATLFVLAAGCSSEEEEADASEDAVSANAPQGPCGATPCGATNDYEQAKTCDKLFEAHAEIRQADLDEGVVRWKCGDVDGVVQPELGQEYCEYHAVAVDAKSKTSIVVDNGNDLGKAKSKTVQCLYTSTYGDIRGRGDAIGNFIIKDEKSAAADVAHVADVAAALSSSSLGPLATITVEGRLASGGRNGPVVKRTLADRPATGMYGRFNTRGAATALINDCANAAAGPSTAADRTAACYRAAKAATTAGDGSKATALETACTGVDLTTDANWAKIAKLGVKLADATDDAAFQNEKDIAACVRTKDGGGVAWRNSDPTICARSLRAASECGTTFGQLPDEPGFIDGFEMTGWNGRSLEGTGCRYVKVAGQEYRQMVLCTPPPAEIEKAITRTKRPLQQVCNDLFGNVVAMQAPIGAIATPKADAKGAFCGSFNKGVAAIKASLAKSPAKN